MGYTNYGYIAKITSKGFSKIFINKVNKIIKLSNIEICNGFGKIGTSPEINQEVINFNGAGEHSHECLYIPTFGKKDDHIFCKTNRKPYDIVVKGVIILACEHGYIKDFTFDGEIDDEEYQAAIELLNKVR